MVGVALSPDTAAAIVEPAAIISPRYVVDGLT
jgi:hypothetical protein